MTELSFLGDLPFHHNIDNRGFNILWSIQTCDTPNFYLWWKFDQSNLIWLKYVVLFYVHELVCVIRYCYFHVSRKRFFLGIKQGLLVPECQWAGHLCMLIKSKTLMFYTCLSCAMGLTMSFSTSPSGHSYNPSNMALCGAPQLRISK